MTEHLPCIGQVFVYIVKIGHEHLAPTPKAVEGFALKSCITLICTNIITHIFYI